jgi:hypothetical protein
MPITPKKTDATKKDEPKAVPAKKVVEKAADKKGDKKGKDSK